MQIQQLFLLQTLAAVESPTFQELHPAHPYQLQRKVAPLEAIGSTLFDLRLLNLHSFGHELAHNFGARHNREEYTEWVGDGYGHLIEV